MCIRDSSESGHLTLHSLLAADRCPEPVAHLESIHHVIDSNHVLGDVFGQAFFVAVLRRPRQCDDSVGDGDVNVRGIDVRMRHESIADLFFDPLVRTPVAFWAAAEKESAPLLTRDVGVWTVSYTHLRAHETP